MEGLSTWFEPNEEVAEHATAYGCRLPSTDKQESWYFSERRVPTLKAIVRNAVKMISSHLMGTNARRGRRTTFLTGILLALAKRAAFVFVHCNVNVWWFSVCCLEVLIVLKYTSLTHLRS